MDDYSTLLTIPCHLGFQVPPTVTQSWFMNVEKCLCRQDSPCRTRNFAGLHKRAWQGNNTAMVMVPAWYHLVSKAGSPEHHRDINERVRIAISPKNVCVHASVHSASCSWAFKWGCNGERWVRQRRGARWTLTCGKGCRWSLRSGSCRSCPSRTCVDAVLCARVGIISPPRRSFAVCLATMQRGVIPGTSLGVSLDAWSLNQSFMGGSYLT